MFEVHFLGTGAMMPLPKRRLASVLVRRNGRLLLIDCGEGTQVAVRESGWSMAKIDQILITHFHAEHIAGLPGLLLTMGTMGRTEPVRLIGPAGLEAVVRCLRVIAPELPYELRFTEICGQAYEDSFADARLTAFELGHVLPCYGYRLELDRPGRFDRSRVEALDIPVTFWHSLQAGDQVEVDGRVFSSDMVLGPARGGISLVYCTDTRPVEAIVRHAAGADLLILEGTYAESNMAEKAGRFGHMTFEDAATLALKAQAKELLLTHFSPAVPDPENYLDIPRAIFPNTDVALDGLRRELRFPD
jgi:ribonuclease Z